ncbi:MAG: glycosyl hydrolase 53 family protein [Eubacterium sp.]
MKKFLKCKGKRICSYVLAFAMFAGLCIGNGGLFKSRDVQAATSVSGVSTVSNMQSDFIKGVDVSALIALENSGASFSYLDGTSGDIFDILAGAGVNYVRIRIWNNPYDSTSPYKGYGGGNCDLYNAKVLGKRATDAGMKVFIDFHYSDFWADPEKQFAPKAWQSYSLSYKKDALYNFTYDSLCELLNYGVDVGMVQIGNETNGSMCGVGGLYDGTWNLSTGVAALMQQGCYAVDDVNDSYGKSILKVLHFTNLLSQGTWYAQCAYNQGIDYDVFATSFYPMWHGSTSALASTLKTIATTYDKKVMVAETAYPYTYTNYDSQVNNIGDSASMTYTNYDVSVSGQAEALRDVFAAVASINATKSGYGLGAFYWEPEWIAVSSSSWGTYGSGWATSTSSNYELLYNSSVNYYSTTDAGTTWDNMTLFDSNGQAMKSLYVFNDISGTTSTTSSGSSGGGSGSTDEDSLDGTYYIKSYYSGLYLDVADGSSSNSANIQQYSYLGTARQQFKLVQNSDGYYTIYTGASDFSKVVDVAGRSTADGANILQYAYSGAINQQFDIVEISSGVYAIKTRVTSSASCLDVYNWSTASGGNIVQWTYWGGACQLWYLEEVSSDSGSSTTTIQLSANNLTTGTYTSNITSGSFTIGASSSKNVQVKSESKTVDGTYYSKVLVMNGGGNSTGRYIKFTTTGAATINITAASTSSSVSRTVRVAKDSVGGTTQSDITVTGTAGKQTVSVSSAGTYYIYSTNSGIYVYDVTVTY